MKKVIAICTLLTGSVLFAQNVHTDRFLGDFSLSTGSAHCEPLIKISEIENPTDQNEFCVSISFPNQTDNQTQIICDINDGHQVMTDRNESFPHYSVSTRNALLFGTSLSRTNITNYFNSLGILKKSTINVLNINIKNSLLSMIESNNIIEPLELPSFTQSTCKYQL